MFLQLLQLRKYHWTYLGFVLDSPPRPAKLLMADSWPVTYLPKARLLVILLRESPGVFQFYLLNLQFLLCKFHSFWQGSDVTTCPGRWNPCFGVSEPKFKAIVKQAQEEKAALRAQIREMEARGELTLKWLRDQALLAGFCRWEKPETTQSDRPLNINRFPFDTLYFLFWIYKRTNSSFINKLCTIKIEQKLKEWKYFIYFSQV